jgi:hypothetical protein
LLVIGLTRQVATVSSDVRTWTRDTALRVQPEATRDLFDDAVRASIVRYDKEADLIVHLTAREARDRDLDRGEWTTTYRRFFRPAGAGAQLRAEIAAHRTERTLVAVRDTGLTQGCAGARCAPPWTITRTDASDLLDLARPGAPVAGAFSVLARAAPGWTLATGADLRPGARYGLAPRHAVGGAGDVVVDVIGRDLVLEGLPVDVAGAGVTSYCFAERGGGTMALGACQTGAAAVAHRIELPAEDWARVTRMTVTSATVPILPAAWREQGRARDPDAGAGRTQIRVDDRFTLTCDPRRCTPGLVPSDLLRRAANDLTAPPLRAERAAEPLPPGFELEPETEPGSASPPEPGRLAALGPLLTRNAGGRVVPSPRAEALGLRPMLGFEELGIESLVNLYANLPPGLRAESIRPTFDLAIQEVVQEVMRAYLVERTLGVQQDALREGAALDRRAAFVLVDLAGAPGAVRAAVGYPFYGAGYSTWDLRELTRASEADSPASPFPWRGLDARFHPGSTFKLVSALALARSATGQTEGVPPPAQGGLAEILLGAPPERVGAVLSFDLRAAEAPVAPPPGINAPPYPLDDRGRPPWPLNEGTAASCGAAGYGVCAALVRSSNMFFGHAALVENRQAVAALRIAPAGGPETAVAQTLRHLGLDGEVDLVPGASDAERGFGPRIEAPLIPTAPTLRDPAPAAQPGAFHERDVAANAIGQNLQITPLAMATVAGAIATGRVVHPRIASVEGHPPRLGAPVLPETPEARRILSEIERGMAGVVQSGGTAAGSFPSSGVAAAGLRDRVFAKTGTPTIREGDPDLLGHWFVGWIDDRDGVPSHAFACAITHVRSGSSPCPAVTGAILGRLSEAGRL